MSKNELNEFISQLEKTTQGLDQYLTVSKAALGQNYFSLHNFSNSLNNNLQGMKLYFEIEEDKVASESIAVKKISGKLNKLFMHVNQERISVVRESDLISLETEIQYNELKFETLFNCLIDNAIGMKASIIQFEVKQLNSKVQLIVKNNGKISDKEKSAPFQKIGHKLIVKICKQLAYDVDFIKSDNGLMTKITF